MEIARTASDLRALLARLRGLGGRLGFVPTMGAFHDGHLALIRAARAACDAVAVSIFVNPLQFGSGEDLAGYPRDEARDLELARAEGVDLAFVPGVADIYPEGHATRVSVGRLGEILEGRSRPGHFDGVCTVVAALLNLVSPDVVFFGQKDAQQVVVVRRMVADLAFPVAIEVCDTVRAEDGLALSSRNAYLGAPDRARAAVLFRALEAGREALSGGDTPRRAEERMARVMSSEPEVALDYARAVDPDDLTAAREGATQVLLVVAARVGPARLIDNLQWSAEAA